MLGTIGNSVNRMNGLLGKFRSAQEEDRQGSSNLVPLPLVVRHVVDNWRKQKQDMIVDTDRSIPLHAASDNA